MRRVVWDRQQEVGDWITARVRGVFHLDSATAIGVERDGKIIGGCMFESYRGKSVVMHVAGEGKHWITREFIAAITGYCFRQLKVDKVVGPIDSHNADVIRLVEHLGFQKEAVIAGAGWDGDLIFYTMTRRQCRFLGE